ncbi:MAG: TraE/TraK family type IV conjugative transfer system protein [Bacteriovoracia bacterium]
MEKGFAAAQVTQPPVGVYDGIDLRVLPKFICFKAALLKSRMTLQHVLLGVAVLFVGSEIAHSLRTSSLEKLLRKKEFILAPGVMDFTTAAPDSVSDNYVMDAANDFLSQFGNVNPTNIEEQYRGLERFMSPQLKMKFQIETKSLVDQIKEDDISQVLTVTHKDFVSNEKGSYKVVAFARADLYSAGEFLGYEDRVVEMVLALVPPDSGMRWYLQIQELKWSLAETFKRSKALQEGTAETQKPAQSK